MKIYKDESVFDAAIQRINRIFDDFDNVVISTSGGKDSTVIMQLALLVAEERNKLPLKMFFIDQEAEYRMTIEYMKQAMADPRVDPLWLQVPIKLFNATSMAEPWLMCWEEGQEWMRPKEEVSIKKNVFNTDRFHQIFAKALAHWFPDEKACYLAGVRADESPQRAAGLTTGQTYQEITYGKVLDAKRQHFTFYPLYDWCLSDVWKSIYDHSWPYCKIYDELYRFGQSPHKMKVSNLHHETAVHSLFFLHEVEPDTWGLLSKRLKGVNQAKHMRKHEMLAVQKLPPMFKDWREYRDYLTENLITLEKHKERFKKRWLQMDEMYDELRNPDEMYNHQIKCLLVNDWEFVKLAGYTNRPYFIAYREWKKGKLHARKRKPRTLIQIKEKYLDA